MLGLVRFLLILLACGSLIRPGVLAATPAEFPISHAVDTIVHRAISDRSIVGAAVAIAVGDEILFSRSYGATDPATSLSVSSNTPFRLGSISKFFTALAILRLVEEGQLRLDTPVADLLADRPLARLLPRTITVQRLLNHTSGVGDRSSGELLAILARDATVTDADIEPVLMTPPLHTPGTNWAYSNTGYRVLSWIVERASRRRFNAYITEVLAPALEVSSVRSCDEPPRPQGYVSRDGVLTPDPSYSIRGLLGEGGLCAAAADLALVPSALLRGRWISHPRLQEMVQPTRLPNGVLVDYGMGVRRGLIGSHTFWGHSGSGLAGGWAALAYYPQDRVTVVVLANGSGGTDDAVTLQAKIAAAYFRVPPLTAAPISPEMEGTVRGTFSDGNTTVCFAAGPNGVTRRTSASQQPPRQLLYQGDGLFAREDYPMDRMAFQIDGGRAVAHRVYYDGFFAELLVPVAQVGC